MGIFDLFVASTRVRPWIRSFPTDLGTSIKTKDHRKIFELKYRNSSYERNDFGPAGNPRLVQVARATSAFPVAFEPIKVAHDQGDPHFASDEPPHSHFTDGGVLHNKPFTETINTIATRAADLPVRRWLVSVEPDPEELSAKEEKTAPDAAEVLAKGAFGIPRYQSIAADLERLNEHREKSLQTRAALDDLDHVVGRQIAIEGLPVQEDLGRAVLGETMLVAYDNSRRSAFSAAMATRISEWVALPHAESKQLSQDLQLRATELEFGLPQADFARERRCIQRLLERIAQGAPTRGADPIRDLQLRLWEAFEGLDGLVWASLDELVPSKAAPPVLDASGAVELAEQLELSLSTRVPEVWEQVTEICRDLDESFPPEVPVASFEVIHRHFEIWDSLLVTGQSPAGSTARDRIRLARISPPDATFIPKTKEKLAGDALGHFGGFIKQEWRENDLMWGRLDAAEIAVGMLFADEQLGPAESGDLIRTVQEEILREVATAGPRG